MTIFQDLSYQTVQLARKLVREEHLRTFQRPLSDAQVDQFLEAYWGEEMEGILRQAIDKKIVE